MSERRYFNLAPVVRDLEHGSGPESTGEGRELWARFCDIVEKACQTTASLDADDEPENEDESDHLDGDEMGDALQQRGRPDDGRLGRNPASGDALQSLVARLESALATQPRPTRGVPHGPPAVDGAGGGLTQRARKVGPRPKVTNGKKRTKKAPSK